MSISAGQGKACYLRGGAGRGGVGRASLTPTKNWTWFFTYRSVPQWLKITSDEVKDQIFQLVKKGLTPSQIEDEEDEEDEDDEEGDEDEEAAAQG